MKRQDRCADFCGPQILGIVQNLKLRGQVSNDFELEVVAVKGFAYVPKGAVEMKCPLHHRRFIVRRKVS